MGRERLERGIYPRGRADDDEQDFLEDEGHPHGDCKGVGGGAGSPQQCRPGVQLFSGFRLLRPIVPRPLLAGFLGVCEDDLNVQFVDLFLSSF